MFFVYGFYIYYVNILTKMAWFTFRKNFHIIYIEPQKKDKLQGGLNGKI